MIAFFYSGRTEQQTRTWPERIQETYSSKEGEMHVAVYDELPQETGIGYAYFPWVSATYRGAVILNGKGFGTNTSDENTSNILIHLIANILGLYPLPGEYKCGDDYVSDTPIHNSPISICTDLTITSTYDNQLYDITNYMSHAPAICKDHFTLGQWRRMLHILNYFNQAK